MDDAERKDRAREALNNPVIQEALKMLAEAYVKAMRQCDPKDDLGRYRYTVALDVVDAVERHLRHSCEFENIEQAQVTELQTQKRFFSRF